MVGWHPALGSSSAGLGRNVREMDATFRATIWLARPPLVSKAVWSGSDPPGPAALGGLWCLLGKPEISAVADWANVIPTGGGQGFLNQEAKWFEVHGFGLATKIAQTALISTGAPGGGQVTAAMADGRELMYLDIVMATTHANFPTFQNFVEQGSFAEANAMLSARTAWAALMARGVTYGASTMTSKVHASESKRRLFNQVVAGYYKLEEKRPRATAPVSETTADPRGRYAEHTLVRRRHLVP